MTTINNIQDLIQLLRDQPHWADELRGILLSDELRDLPAAISVDQELGAFRFALFTAYIGLMGALSIAATRVKGFRSCSITLSRRARHLHSQSSMPAPLALRAAG